MTGALSFTSSSSITRVPVPVAGATPEHKHRHQKKASKNYPLKKETQITIIIQRQNGSSVFAIFEQGRFSIHEALDFNNSSVWSNTQPAGRITANLIPGRNQTPAGSLPILYLEETKQVKTRNENLRLAW